MPERTRSSLFLIIYSFALSCGNFSKQALLPRCLLASTPPQRFSPAPLIARSLPVSEAA
jgi:hypothetical protein